MKRKKIHELYETGDLIFTKRHGLQVILSRVGTGRYRVADVNIHKVIDTDTYEHIGDLLKIADSVSIRRLKPGHRVRHLNLKTFTKLRIGAQVDVLRVGKSTATERLSASVAYQ